MKDTSIVQIKAQLKKKIKSGDYIVLGMMVGVERNAARMRYKRSKEMEVLAMRSWINNREQFVSNYKQLNNID